MSITPLMDKNIGKGFAISTPLLYTLMDLVMSQKSHKKTGAGTSNPALLLDNTAPKCEVLVQQYIWPDSGLFKVGFGWDVMLVGNASKVIFRVLDNTTIFSYIKDMECLYWVTPVSKVVDIGQIADLDVVIT